MKRIKERLLNRAPAVAVLALGAAAITACIESAEPIIIEPDAGPLFERYVSLGNSITAGFQSGGINVQLQREAYPVLLAEKAGAPFGIPALAMPGCPPPLDGPLGEPIADVPCASPPRVLRPPPVVQNLAVPGAAISDLTDPLGTGTPLNSFILGGRTQIGAMLEAEPTLVSAWIGNNDALGAALAGNTLALTPIDAFQADYDELVAAIETSTAQDAILIGVANPMQIAPALQPGAYFWGIAQAPPPGLPGLDVSDNCAPFTQTGDPNPAAFNLVSFSGVARAVAEGRDPLVIDCVTGVETAAGVDFLLDANEQAAVTARVAAFNAHIQAEADGRDWSYVDPAAFILPALGDPSLVRKCQLLPTATDAASFQQALLASCPVDLDPTNGVSFFGDYFSFDGVHPSATAHAVLADTIAGRLNQKHGLSLPTGS